MKIRPQNPRSGGVLIVTLFVVMVIGIAVASYLTLVRNEATVVSRSQNWNSCIPVLEAGVEEAMAQIHYCNNSTNLSSNSWTLGTNGYYNKTRAVGSDGSYCSISIQPVSPPVIYCTGYVPVALSTNFISRQVRISTRQTNGSGGMLAKGIIKISGGYFDSYNSAAGYVAGVHGTNAIAVSDTNVSGAVQLSGSAYIYGMAAVGAGGTVTTSGSAAVGDTNWNASHSGVETNWARNDANVQINSIGTPDYSSWQSSVFILPGRVNGTNYTMVLTNNNYYYLGDLVASSQSAQPMCVVGNVNLYVSGKFTVSGSGFVYLAPGATFTLYVGGTYTVSGGGIMNSTQLPSSLTVYGLSTCTTATYSGSASFVGVLNAPFADFTDSGSADAFGSFTAKTITISGGGNVHYDEALGAAAGTYVATWNEL